MKTQAGVSEYKRKQNPVRRLQQRIKARIGVVQPAGWRLKETPCQLIHRGILVLLARQQEHFLSALQMHR